MHFVSVIIPNYNHAAYLQQRIDSVLNQTYQQFEVIILDDASTDNSREIIETYREHPKVKKILYNEVNGGTTFKQWEKGIEAAKGEWVWIAESDDWCESVLLETLIAGINDKSSVAFAQSLFVLEDYRILGNDNAEHYLQKIAGAEFIQQKMLLNPSITNASMAIFKKELYYKIDKEFTSYLLCGDWLFWILIARQGEVFISGRILNYFRRHANNVSGKAFRRGLFYTEYFKLLNSLERREIITSNQKLESLNWKFRFFLYDSRTDEDVKGDIKNQFKTVLGKNYRKTLLRFQGKQLLVKIKGVIKTFV